VWVWERHHHRDQPGGHAELDDHHPVERADQQHDRHADADLEQRQPQQAAERQFRRRGIGERQESGADLRPEFRRDAGALAHAANSSRAWDL
jgi:hypothetical protein